MTFVVTLRNFRPLPREDGVAWTFARIEESASRDGPWAPLEEFPLAPVDADPRAPAVRNFTSDLATLEQGWYRVLWLDTPGVGQDPSIPVFSDNVTPTAADVRLWSPPEYDWDAAGYPEPGAGEADRLEKRVAWAVAYIQEMTGRQFATMSTDHLAIAEQAVVLRTMQHVSEGSSYARRAFAKPWLKSFTAGSYSETRFSPAELGGNGKDVLLRINPLMELAQLLWLLMTDEKRDEWLAIFAGRIKPAGTFVEMNFGGRHALDLGLHPYDEQGLIE